MLLLVIVLTEIRCPVNTYSKKDIQNMKEMFIMKSGGKRSLFPVVVGLGQQVENIFAVPAKDAIGTIDIDNAISFLEFDDDKVKVKIIKKDFADEVSGEFDFSFMPVYSDEEIAYGQTRWMVFQNLKTKKNHSEFIINNLDDYLGKIRNLSSNAKMFVIEVLKPGGRRGWKKALHVCRFKEEGFDILSVLDAGFKSSAYNEPWTTSGRKLFVYSDTAKNVSVYDENGKQSSHPIQTIFSNNANKFRRIKEILFHPEYPFALIVEFGNVPDLSKLREQRNSGKISTDQYDSLKIPLFEERDRHAIWLARWDTPDTNQQLIPLMSKAGNLIPSLESVKQCSDFQFSPDGKWLVFRDDTGMYGDRNPTFISIPVDAKQPHFFGVPLFLGKVLRDRGEFTEAKGNAWIDKPTSFVVTDGLVLYKWELGNIDKARVINQ